MAVYGYDDYKVVTLRVDILSLPNAFWGSCISGAPSATFYKISEEIPIVKDGYYREVLISNLLKLEEVNLKEGDSTFFHSCCTIPRTLPRTKYKRVLKADKADFCVVPSIKDAYIKGGTFGVFINEEFSRIYLVPEGSANNPFTIEDLRKVPVGTSMQDINPALKTANKKSFNSYYDSELPEPHSRNSILESKLVEVGNFIMITSEDSYILDYFEGTIHDLVSEDCIIESLGTEENQLNGEAIDGIKALIMSEDPAVIGLGLKTLSEMDYPKYKNALIYLLSNSYGHWVGAPLKSSTSVKFMLKYLGLLNGPRTIYEKKISDEDFNLLQHIIKGTVDDEIASLKKDTEEKFPFAKITINVTSTVEKRQNA